MRSLTRLAVLAVFSFSAALTLSGGAQAHYRRGHLHHHYHHAARHKAVHPWEPVAASIVEDAGTGRVYEASNPDERTYPASLTKMMTLYLLFDALKHGKMTMETPLKVSAHAAAQSPSKLGLRPGETITVIDAIKAIVTKSANDVACVIAENLAPTEADFAKRMTAEAHRLGMTRTTFRNASGLPNREQMTTARDMATLARAVIRDFPQYYHFFSTRSFAYKGIVIPNHDRLLYEVKGVDGMKTGFISAAGFNLVTSIKRGNRRLVGVVLGGHSQPSRDKHMARLLENTYARLDAGTAVALNSPTPAASREMRPQEPAATRTAALHETRAQRHQRLREERLARRRAAHERAVRLAALRHEKAVAAREQRLAARRAAHEKALRLAALRHERETRLASASTAHKRHGTETPTRLAQLARPHRHGWAIQVGAFDRHDAAKRAAVLAVRKAPALLRRSHPAVVAYNGDDGTIYRARLVGLTERQARQACRALSQRNIGCLSLAPVGDVTASLE